MFKDLSNHYIKYENIMIPVIFDDNDDVWFAAREVVLALGYPKNKAGLQNAIRNNVFRKHRREYHKFYFDTKEFHQRKLFIREPGLYRLMIRSRKPKAVKFSLWIVEYVLPSIRKFGEYKLSEEHKKNYADIMEKINYLEEENKKLRTDNKKKRVFSKGGLVYVIDYSNKHQTIFRIGKTVNMNTRKQVYDTHTLHNHPVVYFVESDNPLYLESCIRLFLRNFKYNENNNKDFFMCSLKTVIKAFNICIEDIHKMTGNQIGGSSSFINNIIKKIHDEQFIAQNNFNKKMAKLDKQILLEQKSLYAQIENNKFLSKPKTRSINSGSKKSKQIPKKSKPIPKKSKPVSKKSKSMSRTNRLINSGSKTSKPTFKTANKK
jgi:prophage antirepressor-like protein